jgi:hypothetical protein
MLECNNPVDLVFVVDSSGSVGAKNFKSVMNFISNVSTRFDVSASSKDGTRIALIRYSSKSEVIFDFNKYKRLVHINYSCVISVSVKNVVLAKGHGT